MTFKVRTTKLQNGLAMDPPMPYTRVLLCRRRDLGILLTAVGALLTLLTSSIASRTGLISS